MSADSGPQPSNRTPPPNGSLVHLYRGEIARSDMWRSKLDATTNWAVTTTAAVMAYGLANPNTSHVVLLVGIWMVTTFLVLEARRYRYYDLWIRRVRLLEGGFWAPMLRNEPTDPDAFHELSLELCRPQLRLSLFSAVAVRLNRAYSALLLLLLLGWFAKLYERDTPPQSLDELVRRAHVGSIGGTVIVALVLAFAAGAVVLMAIARFTKPPRGEFRARPSSRARSLWEVFARPYRVRAPRRPTSTANDALQ